MTLEVLIDTTTLDPDKWIDFPEYGFRQYFLWKHPTTGASIALLDFAAGGGIPVKHSHASNQFMYCLEGEYSYTDSAMVLQPGSFYMNPKDHPHGPTTALKRSLLVEVYDGPHYYEKPVFHTDETIGDFLAKA
ncbi:cupin domain-containing protein [Ancylobacter sp. WKF20]|uniref:cupin domain-containing protein n=1 Tax=Ancylobacter sp. WKF20 TaxID=3039801 RepID=UPI0024342932|nr:cupin domain-containing protein [Ancylobacter sp. WKF20]WGD29733.1 cupin domain-containing protein [Ancylobacter sp. WKF20]